MPIEIHREPEEIRKAFPRIFERCHFCTRETDMWDKSGFTPVCDSCAKKHDESELPESEGSTYGTV